MPKSCKSDFGAGELTGRPVQRPVAHVIRCRCRAKRVSIRVFSGRRHECFSPMRPWRGIAQPGSAGVLGTPGRRFKSCCPDQHEPATRSSVFMIGVAMSHRRRRTLEMLAGAGQRSCTDPLFLARFTPELLDLVRDGRARDHAKPRPDGRGRSGQDRGAGRMAIGGGSVFPGIDARMAGRRHQGWQETNSGHAGTPHGPSR